MTFSPELKAKNNVRDSPDEHLFERLNAYVKGDPGKIEKIRRDREVELTFQPVLCTKSKEISRDEYVPQCFSFYLNFHNVLLLLS